MVRSTFIKPTSDWSYTCLEIVLLKTGVLCYTGPQQASNLKGQTIYRSGVGPIKDVHHLIMLQGLELVGSKPPPS